VQSLPACAMQTAMFPQPVCKRLILKRKWWNWQTHHLEGVAPKGVGVQIPPSAPIFATGHLSTQRDGYAPGDDECAADQNGERGRLPEFYAGYDLCQQEEKHDIDA
jgi:hypothetical protein